MGEEVKLKTMKILTVDDHEMTMLGYKHILESIQLEGYQITVDTANTYELGERLIIESSAEIIPFLPPVSIILDNW